MSFEKARTIAHRLNTFTELEEITTDICAGEVVNVTAFVRVQSALEEEISTKYGIKKKKDVNIYDNSHSEW